MAVTDSLLDGICARRERFAEAIAAASEVARDEQAETHSWRCGDHLVFCTWYGTIFGEGLSVLQEDRGRAG